MTESPCIATENDNNMLTTKTTNEPLPSVSTAITSTDTQEQDKPTETEVVVSNINTEQDLQQKLEELQARFITAAENISKLLIVKKTLTENVDRLNKENEVLEKKIKEIQKKLKNDQQKNEKLQEENNALREENKTLKKQNKTLKQENNALKEEKEIDQNVLSEANEKLAKVEKKLLLVDPNQNMVQILEQLVKKDYSNLQEEVKSLKNKSFEQDQEISKLKKKTEAQKVDIESIKIELERETKKHNEKVQEIEQSHKKAMTEAKKKHNEEIKKMTEEKERLLEKQSSNETLLKEMEGKIMILRTSHDPNLSATECCGDSPKTIKDSFIDLKTDLRNLVSNIPDSNAEFTEDHEMKLEKILSVILFKTLKQNIVNYMETTHSLTEEIKIGEYLKDSKDCDKICGIVEKELSELLKDDFPTSFKDDQKKQSIYEQFKQEFNTIIHKGINFIARMMAMERKMELVWHDENTKFNPYEQTSQNGTREILIQSVLFPCLLVASNKSVYEPALVCTKDKRLK